MGTSSLSVSVPADARYLKCIRGFMTSIFEARFSDDDVRTLVLAVDEACSNIIKHGQSWLRPKSRITVEIIESKKKIEIAIRDFCRQKDVEKIRPRDLEDVRPGGLGTHFIREVMDAVDFVPDRQKAGRMALVMVKNIGGKNDHEASN